ncbi:DUF4214 domain-containing protein [Massilia yuzhufengensis]|uniref:DUF4214 domain-containing protein n=1 Tax=Massilia yuzhufengensis TaxID=1164594 RepID=A0A1I1UMZ0_9BURK|nr:DUF4214 domain-containing protein [Massilia yuzhufengensis]SFD72156.1 protein of unknown function [Massilia yuzhufengensis]
MTQSRTRYLHAAAVCTACALVLSGCGGDAVDTRAGAQSASRSAATVTAEAQAAEEYAAALQHLYVAYFGRPADVGGMVFWDRQFKLSRAPTEPAALAAQYRWNAGVRQVFDAFSNSAESQQLYPGNTPMFLDGVYRNLFNRSADLPGLAWWTNAIDNGQISRAEAAMSIMLGAQGDDAVAVRNKLAVSASFYRQMSLRVSTVLAYNGTRANELARRMLAQVDAKTDLVAFEAIIKATIDELELPIVTPAG